MTEDLFAPTAAEKIWLRHPSWLPYHDTRPLEGVAADYEIQPDGSLWICTSRLSGLEVYRGIGPIEIVSAPEPD